MKAQATRKYALLLSWIFIVAFALLGIQNVAAQSTVSGDLTGVVSDPSGALVPGATVTVKNDETGRTMTGTTNNQGVYRFALLPPGHYTITVTSPNFASSTLHTNVVVGQSTAANVKMQVQGTQQTVEVTAEGSVIQTDNGNISTSFNAAQIENVPNPGNDLSYIAQAAPGAVMNTQSGYGNFSSFGLPGTSNLFTSNGMYENDPFLNLNNSGATNLMLGANDVSEATVVNNGYTGQYGGLAGSNVNFVTKSGTNHYHGNAEYFYNGDFMNANSWFNNNTGVARPHELANQWAASFGGPIVRDKSFFFVNTEGLYVALPTSQTVLIPSPQLQAAVLGSVPSAEAPFYTQMFNLYNNARGAQNAVPAAGGGCPTPGSGAGFGDAGAPAASLAFAASGAPCADQFRSTAGNHTHEWIISGRYDQNISNSDRAFIHFRTDQGVQATYTDPISPVFNLTSNQPQYEGQLQETHTFGGNATNQFILSGSYYRAIFNVPSVSAALTAMPFTLDFSGSTFYPLGYYNSTPNGRNVTQYQLIDDYSRTVGRHDLKFGINYIRNDVSDYDILEYAQTGTEQAESLDNFFAGQATAYLQQFPTNGRKSAPIATYGLGFYGQDQWAVSKSLKLTLSLRADHNSNPTCIINCFARFSNSFNAIAHDPNQAYNQAFLYNQNQALTHFDALNWQPRIGFAWTPGGQSSFVLRGGFGIFIDKFPATIADSMLFNPPFNNGFVVGGVPLSNAPATAAASNTAFLTGFNTGGTLNSISASNPFFAPPTFISPAGSIHSPRYSTCS